MKEDDRVQSDGNTVWVHDASDGSCIGRFGRLGIDIHRRVSDQATMGQCLLCTHGPTGPDEWQRFVEAMKDIYGVTVTERHRPRYIATDIKEKTMQKMQTYVVTGAHHIVPGLRMSVHFTTSAADKAAFELVELIAANVDGAPAAPADTSQWRSYLADVQRAIISAGGDDLTGQEDEDDLADLAECHVDMTTIEADAPRVIVSLEGGLVQGAASDIELDMYVVDYDTESAPERDLIDIPQDDGETSEGTMRGESVTVDPAWIDNVIEAYEAHDPEAHDDEGDDPEAD